VSFDADCPPVDSQAGLRFGLRELLRIPVQEKAQPTRVSSSSEMMVLGAFRNAAARVPAYQQILREAGMRAEEIKSLDDFKRLPVLEKRNTFRRFEISALCADGVLGRPGTVLTSSGHSGVFAFGVTDADATDSVVNWVDDSLDHLFGVRSRPTLLLNCLPMGVKIPTRACTLAETSVRADMAVGLIRSFGRYFAQIIVVAEAAFLKHVLEKGQHAGIDWRRYLIQVILGEEPLAENARVYLGHLLGHDLRQPEKGLIFSSMGVAELGLNLFFEVPPVAPLIGLRRLLHEDPALRKSLLGPAAWVPSLFAYDPRRIFVEFDESGRLIVTTLDLQLRIPLIRYAPGDHGAFLKLPTHVRHSLAPHGISLEVLDAIPIVSIHGRGEYASAGDARVYPEAVKEALYHDAALAELTTANFRLMSGPSAVEIRIQLSRGIRPRAEFASRFSEAISRYVRAPYTVVCDEYENFQGGMELNYERKFRYVETPRLG
jgi:phenylacetate-CoA ligase